MRKLFLLNIIFLFVTLSAAAQSAAIAKVPNSFYTGKQSKMHIQGVAVDTKHEHIYVSFTDRLVKMDYAGKVIGSVTGFVGHLGDLDFDAETGRIYGSLEYKNDAIGKGINKAVGVANRDAVGFYIAIFEGAKITRENLNAEKDDMLRTIYVKEAVVDYKAKVQMGDRVVDHRFACSGIDGVALAPTIGKSTGSKKFLYVAYGVYGDSTRNDNDHQVILQYDISNWNKLAKPLSQENLHQSGPSKPVNKYFVKTGNTRYGIQNLAYDETSGKFYAAVYRGNKSQFPNYDLFLIDAKKAPSTATFTSDNKLIKVKTLMLADQGLKDKNSGVRGWNFKWGATGIHPLGEGYFIISHNKKAKDGMQESTLVKYKWTGDDKNPFEVVK